MHTDRLLMLADALDQFDERRREATIHITTFDLQTWWSEQNHLTTNDDGALVLPKDFCGTSACACGLAAMLPEFNKLGLNVGSDEDEIGICPIYVDPTDPDETYYDFQAIKRFFGIETGPMHDLFLDNRYMADSRVDNDPEKSVRPTAVAKRIRDFVADPW